MTTGIHWSEALDFAKKLGREPTATAKRLSISRAYYAAFYRARSHLLAVRGTGQDPGHDQVWDAFRVPHNPDYLEVREVGLNLHGWRITADYRDSFPSGWILERKVEQAINQAESLIGLIDAIAGSGWLGSAAAGDTQRTKLLRLVRGCKADQMDAIVSHAETIVDTQTS